MSLATGLNAAFTRIGTEFKSVRSAAEVAASAKAAQALADAQSYVDRENVSVKMVYAHTSKVDGLKVPPTSSEADKLATIAWNTNIIRSAMLANPTAVIRLDPSQAWLFQLDLDELTDATLTPGLDRRLEGRGALAKGTRTSRNDTNPARITAKPLVRITRKPSDPIAVTAIDTIQVGPNLPGSMIWTQFVTGLGFASGYSRFKTGQSLFLRSNDYYAWAMRAVNANSVWKGSWAPVGGVLVNIASYSLTALNASLGLTGQNVLTTLERRTLVGATSGAVALLQGDNGASTPQVIANSLSADFQSGEQIKDQATGAVVGTFASCRVLISGKLNTTYPTSPKVQISAGGVVDLTGLTIECDGDPDEVISEWNRCDAIDIWGGVDVDVRANIKAGYAAGVVLRSCFRFYADLKCQQLPNHALETAASEGAYGYLLRLIGACDTGAARLRGSYLRHLLTTNGAGASYNDLATGYQNFWNYGTARNVVITGMGSRCYGQAWDTHEGAEDITFFDHVTLYPFSAARAVTGPDGAVVRGFGIRHVNPWFVGVNNGINDGGVALDSGGLVYVNEVIGGTIDKFQGIGLTHSDFFSQSQGRILWRDVTLRADPSVLQANKQTIGMLIQSGLVETDGIRIGGVNFAYVQHKSTDSLTGNNSGRVVHRNMVWDGTDAKALSGIRQDSEFAAVDVLGLHLILGATRPTYVFRGFVPGSAVGGQTVAGNATPVRFRGITYSFRTATTTVPGLFENNTNTSTQVTAAITATPMAYLGESAAAGADGKSAYELAVAGGYSGTQTQWLASLKGAKGDSGADSTVPGPASTVPGPAGPGSAGAGIPSTFDAMSPYVRVGANAAIPAPSGGGVAYAYPYPVRVATPVAALVAQVGTAPTGGTISAKMGIWAEGSSGFPDFSSAPILSGAVDLSAVGKKTVAFPANTVLQPGVYWVVFLYLEAVAPTTRPSLYLVNSASWNLALPNASSFANAVGGWKWTGLTDYPSSMTGVGFAGSNDAPVMALRGV